jgi:DNA-binding XRE family transcriptional regulator
MAALVHAKMVKGKKLWYVWGAIGNEKWERTYPNVRSRGELYGILAAELGLPTTVSSTEVVFTLMDKTWNGSGWVDDFSVRLRQLREREGYTQSHLAEKAGLSMQAIAALEQGTRGPTWDTVRRLAHALEVGVEAFKVNLEPEQHARRDDRM